jgi:SAM-dependent methyltransferase
MRIETSEQPDAFRDFEYQGWQTNATGYETHWGPLVRQTVEPTLDAAGISAGMSVLDVCCGPGTLAEAACRRRADVVGLDISGELLELARRNVPDGTFYEGNAEDLPFDEESFDAVIAGYGLMHVARPDAVLREMLRVLRPAGHLAVTVWAKPEPGNGFGILFGAIRQHADLDVDIPHGPDFFQMGDRDQMAAVLSEVGVTNVTTADIQQAWELEDELGIVRAIMEGAVRARALLLSQSPEVKAAVDRTVAKSTQSFRTRDGHYLVPMPAILGAGRKAS